MATLERSAPRAPTAALLLALLAAVSLALSLSGLVPALLRVGAPGAGSQALLSLAGAVVGLLGSAVLLAGALLARRGLPSGPPLARGAALALLGYSIAAVAVGEYLLRTGRADPAVLATPRAGYAGLLGALVIGVLWWGAAWLLARRL